MRRKNALVSRGYATASPLEKDICPAMNAASSLGRGPLPLPPSSWTLLMPCAAADHSGCTWSACYYTQTNAAAPKTAPTKLLTVLIRMYGMFFRCLPQLCTQLVLLKVAGVSLFSTPSVQVGEGSVNCHHCATCSSSTKKICYTTHVSFKPTKYLSCCLGHKQDGRRSTCRIAPPMKQCIVQHYQRNCTYDHTCQ